MHTEFDVIIEGLNWEGRENFDYDAFREALSVSGFYVDQIRFVR